MLRKFLEQLRQLQSIEKMQELVTTELNASVAHLKENGIQFNEDNQIAEAQSINIDDIKYIYHIDHLDFVKNRIEGKPIERFGNVNVMGQHDYGVESFFKSLAAEVDSILKEKNLL